MSEVSVRIFLAGSHEHAWRCATDDPALVVLRDALACNAHPRYAAGSPLVRVLIPDGPGQRERALAFLRTSLVAVEIAPPLVDLLPTVHTARSAAAGPVAGDRVERPNAVVLPGFLTQGDRDNIFAYLLENEPAFTASGVRSAAGSADDDYDYRKSKVLQEFGPFREPFLQAVRRAMGEILPALSIEPPPDPRYELQVTAHNHLDYFKVHRDNCSETVRTRCVSWVWYLHRDPRPFTGGELVLYDTVYGAKGPRRAEGFRVVEPADNTLVAFPSDCWHQVRAIRCPSQAFADSRFTVNGWLRDPRRATTGEAEGSAVG